MTSSASAVFQQGSVCTASVQTRKFRYILYQPVAWLGKVPGFATLHLRPCLHNICANQKASVHPGSTHRWLGKAPCFATLHPFVFPRAWMCFNFDERFLGRACDSSHRTFLGKWAGVCEGVRVGLALPMPFSLCSVRTWGPCWSAGRSCACECRVSRRDVAACQREVARSVRSQFIRIRTRS